VAQRLQSSGHHRVRAATWAPGPHLHCLFISGVHSLVALGDGFRIFGPMQDARLIKRGRNYHDSKTRAACHFNFQRFTAYEVIQHLNIA